MRTPITLKIIEDTIAQGPYAPNWSSLQQHATPKWLTHAKFGIFIHWGVYSVPAFANEWYPRNMYMQGSREFEHHVKTYGHHKDFGYKDFIPMFNAENYDATKWAKLFADSGARYVMPVAEHHDGFQMYDSDLSDYNVAKMGPKRDTFAGLKEAVEEEGMTFCASTHRAEHWFFMSHGKEFDSDIKEPLQKGDFYWPAQQEYDHQDIHCPGPSEEYLQDWLLRTCEIVTRYQPRIIYFDWWIHHEAFKPYLQKFAAFYYNYALAHSIEVAINYKHDAFVFGTAVVDIERGQFAGIQPYFWQTDTAIAKNSWCYTDGNDFKTAREILCDLVDVVSKNGTMLLNVGPKADGSISLEDEKVLREIGAWLRINGEAIYDSSFYRVWGEGPTQVPEGQFTDVATKVFTHEDIRYTTRDGCLYATVLNYPEDGVVKLRTLSSKSASHLPHFHGIIGDVSILGHDEKPTVMRTEEALVLTTKHVHSDLPVVLRIALN